MGINISRIGDACQGICTVGEPHAATGYILGPCASKVFAEGLNVARVSDIVVTDHEHDGEQIPGTIIDGGVLTNVEGLAAARIGSYFTGAFFGQIIEGADAVNGG